MLILTDDAGFVAPLSSCAVANECTIKPVQSEFGCLFHFILELPGLLSAPIKLFTAQKVVEEEIECNS